MKDVSCVVSILVPCVVSTSKPYVVSRLESYVVLRLVLCHIKTIYVVLYQDMTCVVSTREVILCDVLLIMVVRDG